MATELFAGTTIFSLALYLGRRTITRAQGSPECTTMERKTTTCYGTNFPCKTRVSVHQPPKSLITGRAHAPSAQSVLLSVAQPPRSQPWRRISKFSMPDAKSSPLHPPPHRPHHLRQPHLSRIPSRLKATASSSPPSSPPTPPPPTPPTAIPFHRIHTPRVLSSPPPHVEITLPRLQRNVNDVSSLTGLRRWTRLSARRWRNTAGVAGLGLPLPESCLRNIMQS